MTIHQARVEKNASDWKSLADDERASKSANLEMDALKAYPQIGVLGHGKNRRYYTGDGSNATKNLASLIAGLV